MKYLELNEIIERLNNETIEILKKNKLEKIEKEKVIKMINLYNLELLRRIINKDIINKI